MTRLLGLDPKRVYYTILGMPVFIMDWIKYAKKSPAVGRFRVSFKDIYPVYYDRFESAGVAKGHYFHQDLWAAKKIYTAKPKIHIDIGSRVDGFISHLLVFRDVTVVDVRPLESEVPGLGFAKGDITALDYDDNSIESISCLHAIEHIGLGRYGDKVDYFGWERATNQLQRVLKPGGVLYLGVPIGRERVCFNAHRVFTVNTILSAFNNLTLRSFSYIDDNGDLHSDVQVEDVPELEYGCGLFEFVKK